VELFKSMQKIMRDCLKVNMEKKEKIKENS
jgi:hypothetical protein